MIPGFIDLQVNGFIGVGFSSLSLTEERFIHASGELLKRGTAAFLPTVVTGPEHMYQQNLPLISAMMSREEFKGRILGIHIEGPFISRQPGAVGAHNPEWVRKPSVEFFKRLQEWANGAISLLTVAAEVEGAAEVAEYATSQGIVVSLGHHMATDDDIARLSQAGAVALTHLGNGMPNQLPRHPNPLWAGLAADDLTAMIIADGHHLPPSVLKSIIRAKGVEKTVVTSDASSVAGLPPGDYTTPSNKVILEESGRLHNPEKKCLVGSSATMFECMNHLAGLGFLELEDLIAVGFSNPLNLINVDPNSIAAESSVSFNPETNQFEIEGFSKECSV